MAKLFVARSKIDCVYVSQIWLKNDHGLCASTCCDFSTGDELVPHGRPLEGGKIYDSNRRTLVLLSKQLACEVIDLVILEDSKHKLTQTLTDVTEHTDLIITSSGVSVGEADYVKEVLCQLGLVNFQGDKLGWDTDGQGCYR